MATDGNTPSKKNDDPERSGNVARPSGSGVALADEGDVAFGAMTGIAVISAVLVSMLALAGFFGYQAPDRGADTVAAAAESADDAHADEADDAHADDAHDEGTDADADATADAEAEEAERLAAEEAAAEEAAAAAEAEAAAEEEAAAVEEAAAEAAAAEAAAEAGAAAVVSVSQTAVVLDGTVPDQATADSLLAAAVASGYTDDQITNNLVVNDGATPYTLTVEGALTSQAAATSLAGNFSATGAGLADGFTFDDQIELAESSDLEAELNALVTATPILFNSGTDVITAETAPVVAQVAELLAASDEQVEIGGHTDSRGGDAGNLTLSNQRAARVVQELVALGIDADRLVAKGYGETQLVENPDDTREQQQANRRIEFRVLG